MHRIVFIFFWIYSFCFGADAPFESHFFDVGQGNCALFHFGKGPPLLVDAGSSWLFGDNELEKANFKSKQTSKIALKIKEYIPTDKRMFPINLNILVSHGDSDHYNWIPDILKGFKPKDLCVRFLLGGAKKDYSKKLEKVINKFATKDSRYKERYISEYNKITDIPVIECNNATCTILAAETTADTNRNSIVLKLAQGIFSLILTGDATEKTTNAIIDRYTNESRLAELQTTILQASHHGAASEGSNNIKWINVTQPTYVVISAGERRDYRHPHQSSIENFTLSPKLKKDASIHFLQYYGEKTFTDYHIMLDSPHTFARLRTGYVVAITPVGIFNTANQGDISFSGDKITNLTKIPTDSNMKSISTHGELALYFLRERRVSETIGLKFPRMNLSDTTFQELLNNPVSLISCDLSLVDLTHVSKDALRSLIERHRDLKDLKLPTLEKTKQDEVENTWNNRGLSFDDA